MLQVQAHQGQGETKLVLFEACVELIAEEEYRS
jgi:hypothetical protein